MYEADRHAKKELKKRGRGIRSIERQVEKQSGPEAEAIRGYCAAVRSALTDDGRPPLEASGVKTPRAFGGHCQQSPTGREKGGCHGNFSDEEDSRAGLQETAEWPAIKRPTALDPSGRSPSLKIDGNLNGRMLPCRLRGLLGTMAGHRQGGPVDRFLAAVSVFACGVKVPDDVVDEGKYLLPVLLPSER